MSSVRSIVAPAFLLLLAAPATATDHTGNIAANTTWFAADNPHVIVENVTVDAA